jgi:hypothetical protein
MELSDLQDYPQPEWNDPGSVHAALGAIQRVHDEPSAIEACDRFLWAVGNNHSGTFYPVVLAALPQLEQTLLHGGAWAQRVAMEALIDLGGTFMPEAGHETHLGTSVQGEIQAFIQSLRPRIVPLATGNDVRARSAADLLELIDDHAGGGLRHGN